MRAAFSAVIVFSGLAWGAPKSPLAPPAPTAKPITAPLRALSTNPNYFTDGSGKAIYLTGSHTWNNLQDWGTNGSIQPLDFTAYVKMLVAHNHNFTLLWATELPTFRRLAHHGELSAGFQRHSTALAADRPGQCIGRETEIRSDKIQSSVL